MTATALEGARLGLLSDSHGRAVMTRRAVWALLERGADAVAHLGDVCSFEVLDELAGLRGADGRAVPARVVFGNMDEDIRAMAEYARSLGIGVDHPAGRLELAGKSIVIHHGHDPGRERAVVEAGVDYFCHGHTHRLRDEIVGRTRIINPGALFRASRHTAALLDCRSGRLEIVDLDAAD